MTTINRRSFKKLERAAARLFAEPATPRAASPEERSEQRAALVRMLVRFSSSDDPELRAEARAKLARLDPKRAEQRKAMGLACSTALRTPAMQIQPSGAMVFSVVRDRA